MPSSISVAMATFNGSRFIEAQLQSIAAQTLAPAELVICDDGSTDDTIAKIERFRETSAVPVHVHRNEVNLGYVENFLRAARLCRSEIVAFSDQDDIWDPRKLELCAPAFDDPSVMLCYHDIKVVDVDLNPLYDFKLMDGRSGKQDASTMWPGRYPWGLAQLFRRDLLEVTEGLRRPIGYHSVVRIGHDEWIAFIGDVFGATFSVKQNLVLYRQHGSNASGGRRPTGNLLSQIRRQDADNLKNIAASLKSQVEVLTEFRERVNPRDREHLETAIRRKAQLSDLFFRRWQLYASQNIRARAESFAKLLWWRAYGPEGSNRLPLRALARDSVFALLGPEAPEAVASSGLGRP